MRPQPVPESMASGSGGTVDVVVVVATVVVVVAGSDVAVVGDPVVVWGTDVVVTCDVALGTAVVCDDVVCPPPHEPTSSARHTTARPIGT